MNTICRSGHVERFFAGLICILFALALGGCGNSESNSRLTPEGAIVGRGGFYNYSPSVIQEGTTLRIWWCGEAVNPNNTQQLSDGILYETVDTVTNEKSQPLVVLAETQGAWDSMFTCNPRVIRGVFVNPLGNGLTYTYELFYVGSTSGIANSIGAAFSNDGIHWTKDPVPVIWTSSSSNYGVGQPAAYNSDGKSAITLFYEDVTPSVHHVEATSTDGVHFTIQGTITTNGIDSNNPDPEWGDLGYDAVAGYWYAAFNLPLRDWSTTGGFAERGQYGVQLYRIPAASLLTGTQPWQMLKTFDTNLTGYEANFLPSLLHADNGSLNVGSYPTIQIFLSTSLPRPAWDATPMQSGKSADIYQWAIAENSYDPSENVATLKRYINAKTYLVTTGYVDPVRFFFNKSIAHLYIAPQNGATLAFYSCKEGNTAYFPSLKPTCEGQFIRGINGYGWATPPVGIATVALYRCRSQQYGQFISKDAACEGDGSGTLMGYALP